MTSTPLLILISAFAYFAQIHSLEDPGLSSGANFDETIPTTAEPPPEWEGSGVGDSVDSLLPLRDASGEGEPNALTESEGSGDGDEEKKWVFVATTTPSGQLFRPNITVEFNPLNRCVEEFVGKDMTDCEKQPKLTELAIGLRTFVFRNESYAAIECKYSEALANLLVALPNLQILHPIGGHLFFEEGVTQDQILAEIRFVRDALDTFAAQMRAHNLTLWSERFDYIKYSLYIVGSEEATNSTQIAEALKKEFGRGIIPIRTNGSVRTHTILYEAAGLNVKLDNVLYGDLNAVKEAGVRPKGRVDYADVLERLSRVGRKPTPNDFS